MTILVVQTIKQLITSILYGGEKGCVGFLWFINITIVLSFGFCLVDRVYNPCDVMQRQHDYVSITYMLIICLYLEIADGIKNKKNQH